MANTKTLSSKQGQTLFTIAIQEYGSIDGLFYLCLDNNIHNLNTALPEGTQLQIRTEPTNARNVDLLRTFNPLTRS